MFPILKLPPTSLPKPSLWVIPVHQPQASCILHGTWTGDLIHIWYYTCFNAILPNHPTLSLSLSHRVQKTVPYIWVSLQSCFYFFSCLCFWCHIYKALLRPTSRSFSPIFSSRSFRVSSLTFESLIYFKLLFVGGIRIQFYSFACKYPVFPAPCIPYWLFLTLLLNILTRYAWVHY